MSVHNQISKQFLDRILPVSLLKKRSVDQDDFISQQTNYYVLFS